MLVVSLKKFQDVAEAVEFRSGFQKTAFPVIFKLDWRDGSLFERLRLYPDYIDLDHEAPAALLAEIKASFPAIQIILSCHCFEEGDGEAILQKIIRKPADLYKIAVHCSSSLEVLRLMGFPLPEELQGRVIRIPMGEEASFGRLLGKVLGNPIDYCCLHPGEKAAPGQLDLKTMTEDYHYKRLDRKTALYALIGDPVEQSRGHLVHNSWIRERGLNALYLKIKVKKEELGSFFSMARKLPFQGFSVTMPLKEEVIPYLDHLDISAKGAGAVNTVVRRGDGFTGYNTDGKGALNALEKVIRVRGKRMVILGAGGACRAIAFEARQRGAALTILNRTPERAREVADLLNVPWGFIGKIPDHDILVNTTSVGMAPDSDASLLSGDAIIPSTVVFDIVAYPPETKLLTLAKAKGCQTVSGREMFLEQARLQSALLLQPDR